MMIQKKLKGEYVDCIANSYVRIDLNSDDAVETFARTYEVLKKDYDIDMLSLPFLTKGLKEKIEDCVLNIDEEINISI